MTDSQEIDGQLLRGLLDTLVLDVLADGPNYGFGILDALGRSLGDDAGIVKEATLYPILHRLAARGCLASHEEPGDRGRPRRYYRLTNDGVALLEARRDEWTRIAELLERTLLHPGSRTPPVTNPSRHEPRTLRSSCTSEPFSASPSPASHREP